MVSHLIIPLITLESSEGERMQYMSPEVIHCCVYNTLILSLYFLADDIL